MKLAYSLMTTGFTFLLMIIHKYNILILSALWWLCVQKLIVSYYSTRIAKVRLVLHLTYVLLLFSWLGKFSLALCTTRVQCLPMWCINTLKLVMICVLLVVESQTCNWGKREQAPHQWVERQNFSDIYTYVLYDVRPVHVYACHVRTLCAWSN